MKRGFVVYLHSITVALVLAVLCSLHFGKIFTGQMPPGMPDFDALFKDFDFEKFVQELDTQLAEIEAEELSEASGQPAYQPPVKPASKPDTEIIGDARPGIIASMNTPSVSDDPEELIIAPPIVTVARKGKQLQLPHKNAEQALISYLDDINTALRGIDHAALSAFGEEFNQRYFAQCEDIVVDILVSLDMITSKRAYRVAVLAPPPPLAEVLLQYRKNIITVRKNLMNLHAKLAVTEEDELAKEKFMQDQLEALARIDTTLTSKNDALPAYKAPNAAALPQQQLDYDTQFDQPGNYYQEEYAQYSPYQANVDNQHSTNPYQNLQQDNELYQPYDDNNQSLQNEEQV